MQSFEQLSASKKYIALALAGDALLKDQPVVFHYYGSKELKKYVPELSKMGISEIVKRLYSLEEEAFASLNDSPPLFRATYLASQIRSLRGLLEFKDFKPEGDALIKAVNTILGIQPSAPYDLDEIKGTERAIFNKYGCGSYDEFKSETEKVYSKKMPDREINEQIAQLKKFCKKDIIPHLFCADQMADFIERSETKLVRPKKGESPCYYVYKGGGKATICLSNDHRKNGLNTYRSLLHELFPGHHLYYLYRNMLFEQGIVGEEATLDLLYSSETPIAEGVAETAMYYLDSLPAGLRRMIEISTAREHFGKKILYNAWYYLFVEKSMSKDEAILYMAKEGCYNAKNAEVWYNFISDWRIYYPAYPIGTDALKKQIHTGSKDGLYFLYLPKTMSLLEKNGDCEQKNSERASSAEGGSASGGGLNSANERGMGGNGEVFRAGRSPH